LEIEKRCYFMLLNVDGTNNHRCVLNQVNLKLLIRSVPVV